MRRELQAQAAAATAIQASWRRHCAQMSFQRQRQAAIQLQAAFRCSVARAHFRELRKVVRVLLEILWAQLVLCALPCGSEGSLACMLGGAAREVSAGTCYTFTAPLIFCKLCRVLSPFRGTGVATLHAAACRSSSMLPLPSRYMYTYIVCLEVCGRAWLSFMHQGELLTAAGNHI